MFWQVLLSLAVSVTAGCVDGKDNVIDIEDVSGGNFDIHFHNVIGRTYDAHNASSCHGSDAQLALTGMIKLVSGAIAVTAANDLKSSGDVRLTLKKNSMLIGNVCKDGKAKAPGVTDKDCNASIYGLLGPDFTKILSTPGTYNLAQIEAMGGFGNVIMLPSIPGSVNTIAKGEWQGQLALYSNGRQVAAIKLPSNKPWLYIN